MIIIRPRRKRHLAHGASRTLTVVCVYLGLALRCSTMPRPLSDQYFTTSRQFDPVTLWVLYSVAPLSVSVPQVKAFGLSDYHQSVLYLKAGSLSSGSRQHHDLDLNRSTGSIQSHRQGPRQGQRASEHWPPKAYNLPYILRSRVASVRLRHALDANLLRSWPRPGSCSAMPFVTHKYLKTVPLSVFA